MKFRFYALTLCGIIALIFLAQVLFPLFTDAFVLDKRAFVEGWRFISAIFLHGSLAHLIYNLFALALFGSILESLCGARKFLSAFFATGMLANLISINFYPVSLGASGAIFGVIGALIAVRPLLIVWAFGMPMPIFLAGILWGAGDLIGAYGFLTGNPIDDTGNIAHLSGMFFGFILGALYREKRRHKKKVTKISIDERRMQDWERRYLRK